MCTHKSMSRRATHPLYSCIRGNGGWDAVDFSVLEMNLDLSKTALRKKEQDYIQNLSPVFNKNRAYTELSGTPYHREYRASRGLDHFRTYNRDYRAMNRDRIKEQRRLARERRRAEVSELHEVVRVLETLRDS